MRGSEKAAEQHCVCWRGEKREGRGLGRKSTFAVSISLMNERKDDEIFLRYEKCVPPLGDSFVALRCVSALASAGSPEKNIDVGRKGR